MYDTTALPTATDLVQSVLPVLTTALESLLPCMIAPESTSASIEHAILAAFRPVTAQLFTVVLTQMTSHPPRTSPCACGALARYVRMRAATLITTVGTIAVPRALYHCAVCGAWQYPDDARLHLVAGSRTPHLTELLALLGTTLDSFAAAATTLERLTGLHLSPTTIWHAAHEVGEDLLQQHDAQVTAITTALTPPTDAAPTTVVVSMDGGMVHEREHGWRELKVATVWDVAPGAPPPQVLARRDRAEAFGSHVWAVAAQQGVEQAQEVVVIGDGAHGIWNLAQQQFPQATEIVDWYHVTQTLWRVAHAMWPDNESHQHAWMQTQQTALWAGDVVAVQQALADLHTGEPQTEVDGAVTYLKNHQHRMAYARYRDRGLPCGSGRIESSVKQVVTMRLKGPGMRWSAHGVARMAHLRAVLLSKHWDTAMAERSWRPRPSRQPCPKAVPVGPESPDKEAAHAPRLDPDLCAAIRAELAPAARHPWRQAWSVNRQRQIHEDHAGSVSVNTHDNI